MWLFLWRASLLYVFPLLMWGYCRIKDIEFAELDTGVNTHKWVVLAAYLIYVVIWILVNRYLELFLRQRSRK
ncbi:hypothetical protein JFQ87_003024 [Aeromonas veronii]|uniref:hypothetical protein n=1 Tax=Aeromonas veronii TaxID=654 RepID=UPI00222EAD2B|nr:hypothetical protein [Aeromonas veronii]EKP0300446.1 hypothetical protein [Aeromonas veronii]UZE59489.1 hypothetical protein ONR73_22160 [Aeromonas veronii]